MKAKLKNQEMPGRRSLKKFAPPGIAISATVVVIGLALYDATPVKALGFRVPNQDTEAIARGNAFVATADNPSAIYYNPAGITQLDGANAQFGIHALSINSFYNSPSGGSSESRFGVNVVPQFYCTYKMEDLPISFGLGMYAPYGLALQWPVGSNFRSDGVSIFEGSMNYITINPVIAWKICDQLSVAAGPTLNYSQVLLIESLPGSQFKFRGDGFDVGFTAGIMYKPFEQWSFGANYHSGTKINFDGNASTSTYGNSHSTVDIPLSQFIMGGVSFRPTTNWNFEVDADWTDWHRLKSVTFNNTPFGNVPFPLDWNSSWMFGVGGTRYLKNGYFVSAGYFYSGNSTTTQYFTPIVPDTELHVGSVGFGHKSDHWSWAIAAQIITGPERSVTGDVGDPAANGTYQWINESIDFSVGYHF